LLQCPHILNIHNHCDNIDSEQSKAIVTTSMRQLLGKNTNIINNGVNVLYILICCGFDQVV